MLRTGPVKRRRGAIGEERRWEGLPATQKLADHFRIARYTCAEVSFGCRKRSIQYAQPNTIGKRMRSTVTRTWTLGGGAPLKLINQSAVNTTMNVQSTRWPAKRRACV